MKRLCILIATATAALAPSDALAHTRCPAVRLSSHAVLRNIQEDRLACSAAWNYSYQIAQEVQRRHLFGKHRGFNWQGWRIRVDGEGVVSHRPQRIYLSFVRRPH
jgi:hypothetical protein